MFNLKVKYGMVKCHEGLRVCFSTIGVICTRFVIHHRETFTISQNIQNSPRALLFLLEVFIFIHLLDLIRRLLTKRSVKKRFYYS